MKYRTIWISDIHLGSKGCQSELLLNFLKNNDSEYLILVGDIIDLWALSRKSYWPASHNTIIQKILKKARHGTKVIYIPGNHDDPIREYANMTFGGIEIHTDYIHTLSTGKTIFCLHGDVYDIITQYSKWLSMVGDIGYTYLLWLNRVQNKIRRIFGKDHWSFSSFIKHKVKEAVNFIGNYEKTVANEAEKLQVDGILCGHIHHPEIKQIGNTIYYNTGDWVESCTALVEHENGNIELIKWTNIV